MQTLQAEVEEWFIIITHISQVFTSITDQEDRFGVCFFSIDMLLEEEEKKSTMEWCDEAAAAPKLIILR